MPENILIVEDEVIIAAGLESIVMDLGYQVCAFAATAAEAIQKVGDCRPDLVLMDIRLKGKEDGIQAAQKIKELYDVPVIFVTAFSDQELLNQAKKAEPFGYILKPVEPRTLEVAMATALYKHQAEKDKLALQARLAQLEKQVALQKSEERFRAFMDNSQLLAWAKDTRGRYVYLNKTYERLCECRGKDWYGKTDRELWCADIAEKFRKHDAAALESGQPVEFIEEITGPQGDYRVWWMIEFGFEDEAGAPYVGGMAIDNTARLRAERELQEALSNLAARQKKIEEINTTLKVILDQREHDKVELQESILANVKQIILPCLEKLKNTPLSPEQIRQVDVLEAAVHKIVSPFVQKLSHAFLGLSPGEIRIAEMIKEGLQTKEIAAAVNLSPETVRSYRESLRQKLGLQGKKVNLRTFLQILE
jgi:two-component system, response regulator PdtaR